MTVEDLIEELQKMPPEAEVRRLMTADFGWIELEGVKYNDATDTVDLD